MVIYTYLLLLCSSYLCIVYTEYFTFIVKLQNESNFEVGKLYSINCTLYTGQPVNSSDVSISWSGPNGVVVANESSRITVIPTTSNGYNHTSTLQFSYISEDDEDTSYNCTASLSGEDELLSKSFTVSSVTSKMDINSVVYTINILLSLQTLLHCDVII